MLYVLLPTPCLAMPKGSSAPITYASSWVAPYSGKLVRKSDDDTTFMPPVSANKLAASVIPVMSCSPDLRSSSAWHCTRCRGSSAAETALGPLRWSSRKWFKNLNVARFLGGSLKPLKLHKLPRNHGALKTL